MGIVWPFLLTILIAQLLMMWRPNGNECLTVFHRVREKQFVKSASPKLTPLHHVFLNMQQAKQVATCLPSIWISALWQRRKNVQSVRFWLFVLILLSLRFLVNKTAHKALCFVRSCVESTFSRAILAVFFCGGSAQKIV